MFLVAEGSGGHLIPALQVAGELARGGACVKVWYAERQGTVRLAEALVRESTQPRVEVEGIPTKTRVSVLGRLWSSGALWWSSRRCFESFHPDVVAGFGGWVSAPVVLAARQRRIPVLVHEQNVHVGRANRLLIRWANRVAISFERTRSLLNGTPSVLTGLPIRRPIGSCARQQAAARFNLDATRPTLLMLGGSQGAHAINQLFTRALPRLSDAERSTWQVIHLTGTADEAAVKTAYASVGLRAHVAAFSTEMDAAYALADLVIARAGASTIAELAHCGTPAILIPYPGAGGHQRANAQLVEAVGGGMLLEEAEATPERLLDGIRRLLQDQGLREQMATRVRALAVPDATARLSAAIIELADTP